MTRGVLVLGMIAACGIGAMHSAMAAGPTKKSSTRVAAKPATPQPPAEKRPVLVPGTGVAIKYGTDDFEDEKWAMNYRHPKSSEEQDKRMRGPLARSTNGMWFEGPKRGIPDVVKRVPLPAPGLEGSEHGMLVATLRAGIPGRVTYQMQQDDLIFSMSKAAGNGISVRDSPSIVTRVYLPPFEQWEQRRGPSFGFRAGCFTHAIITGDDHPDEGKFGLEEYWPGMFISFQPKSEKMKVEEPYATILVRAGRRGLEVQGPKITELGWWTLGLSFSPDGMVHYFASPGVDDLTMDDHITSQFPYGYRTEFVKTFFYNVCAMDDGKSWSTPWVIDDPRVYFVKRPQMATQQRSSRK